MVVSLFSGLASPFVVLCAAGVRFYGVTVEMDPDAARCTEQNFPDAIHFEDVAKFQAEVLLPLIKKRQLTHVLIVAGPPCQGNSALNLQRKGTKDERTLIADNVWRIRDEVHRLKVKWTLQVFTLLENVGSAPQDSVQFYSRGAGADPLRVDAAYFGWVARSRLLFGRGPRTPSGLR